MIFLDPEFKEIVASVRPRLNFSNGGDMRTRSPCPAGAEDGEGGDGVGGEEGERA